VLLRVNDFHSMTTFQQRALRRAYSVIVVGAALVAFGLFGYGVLVNILPPPHRDKLALTVPFISIVGIIGTVWWYILSLKRDLRDWNLLMDQITEMYGGNLDAVNHVPPTSNLYDCAMQLNMIRTGVQKAVEEGTKADRTKIELITNVSHDIKTPLTSVISYVELLKKEELSPAARDYVEILSGKAQRLSGIVQDVFEVSKATTGNISLNLEDLDIGRLLKQTFGEMEEVIERSKLQFRVDIPETPMLVHADGQRMYRVFQNLIRNCTQYSLEGSRVYVSLVAQSGLASVGIRNISKTEITMNGEDLTARFVRGDQNRTTEGSGLGLSIAKSFTEACDGDLFVATVQFPLVGGEEQKLQA
jgi:signal transduction histidine kinase